MFVCASNLLQFLIGSMFLNLKSKRVQTALQNHLRNNNHPKTQREQRQERLSKEHAQVRTKKQAIQGVVKKQTASTALTTMQTGSSYSNVAHHYVIHRIESLQKESGQPFSKSIEKMDSQRSQKIANAYRKIKKYDGVEHRVQTEESGEQKSKRSQNRTHYPFSKKQGLGNLINNYIAITEGEEQDERKQQRGEQRQLVEYCYRVIQLFLDIFRKQSKTKSSSVVKFRSISSKDIDLNASLQKNKKSNKNLKNRGKGLVNTQHSNYEEEPESFQDYIQKIKQNLVKSEEMFDNLRSFTSDIHISSLMKQLYAQLCWFVKQVQIKYTAQVEEKCAQYQKGLQIVVLQQIHMQKHIRSLEKALAIERNRNSILAQSLQQLHNKSLYSCAFINQISFNFDVDSFIHEKICEFAEENPSLLQSRMEQGNSEALKEQFLDSNFAFSKEKQKQKQKEKK